MNRHNQWVDWNLLNNMSQLRLKPFEGYEKVTAMTRAESLAAQVERGTVALGSKTVGSSAFLEDQRGWGGGTSWANVSCDGCRMIGMIKPYGNPQKRLVMAQLCLVYC